MIGVYDSGYGGLDVLRHLRLALPGADFIYLGDSGRAPYGGRASDTILDFAEQAVERLFDEGCVVVVVACNTVSCVALRHLQKRYCPPEGHRRILGVTVPGAELVATTKVRHVGILATQRTVASGTYPDEISKLCNTRVTQHAAPLLAAVVEEGWEHTRIAELAVASYLSAFHDIDALLLGCTHYPLLQDMFRRALPAHVVTLDHAPYLADRLVDWLARHPEIASSCTMNRALRVLCTGDPDTFGSVGERFLGECLPTVEHIAEVSGLLTHHQPNGPPRGQVIRGGALEPQEEESHGT